MNAIARFACMVAIIYLVLCSTIFAQAQQNVVEIPDPNLRRAVGEALNLSDDIPITRADMKTLTDIDVSDRGIVDLTGLEFATEIGWLSIPGNQITDLTPIAELTNLDTVLMWSNPISDITPLANLTQLRGLDAGGCQISDISPLATLTRLVFVNLRYNRITDIEPLSNLTQITQLFLNDNQITDVSPLANLIALEELHIAGNPLHDFSPLFELEGVELDIEISEELNVVVDVPDANLEVTIREVLNLAGNIPLTQLQMLGLEGLDAGGNRGIADLTGLEYAGNLRTLGLAHNPIVDISALTHLTKLEAFNFWGCQIVDLTPIRNLKNLKSIHLVDNEISDISPLSELTNLTFLDISSNRIVDVSPLVNLVNLKTLLIQNNLIVDHSPLDALDLEKFTYDECCELPRLPVQERIVNRTFPSVFAAWGGVGWSPVVNQPHLSDLEHMSQHDLYFCCLSFDQRFFNTGNRWEVRGDNERAEQMRDDYLALNPDMIFLVEVRVRDYPPEAFPSDSPYWARDEDGNPITSGNWLLDFTHPDMQDMIVDRALAVAKCGLYDGVMLDWWNEDWPTLNGYRTIEQERTARLNIVRRIREAVGDEFLIIGNGNRRIFPVTGTYINGTYMETGRDDDSGYTYEGLTEIETSLTWAEENLRKPKINALEGWSIPWEPLDSPANMRWMRVFTTMGLTHSDGYVLYKDGTRGKHHWYDFWNAELGRPIGEKKAHYANRDGLFIREFSNGWAVYNRSGETQQIELSEDVTGVESGEKGRIHLLPDLDGEIYLRVAPRTPWDVNQDGITDIFDLIAVAKRFGKDNRENDLNGDGTVDIFDLVIVAKHLGDSTNPAAPVIGANSHLLSSRTVKGWIDMAQLAHDGSPVFRQGIANLKHLLTTLVPDMTVLLSNYPNPFNPETWIPYHIAADADVTITIYSLGGELVRRLDLGLQVAGYYVDKNRAAHWDGTNEAGESVASGVYFIKMEAGEFIASKRMVVVK